MSFINKKTDTSVIRAKLTDRGRELLGEGNLTYRFWAIGDSEIDYNFLFNSGEDESNFNVLSPKDNTKELKYPIPVFEGGDSLSTLTSTNVAPKTVNGKKITKGFFNLTDNGFEVDTSLFKRVGTVTNGSLTGTRNLTVTLSNVNTNNTIKQGDVLILSIPTGSTTSVTPNIISPETPLVFLSYKVVTVNSQTSLVVDRNLPNIGSGTATCALFVLEGDDPINNYYSTYSPEYWDYDNLSFQVNDNNVANNVPVWNFNVVLTEDLPGVDPNAMNNINEYAGRFYAGFKNFLNQGLYNDRKSLGIIHFSNNMTTNVYGESFKRGSFTLHLPSVLYHNNGESTGEGKTLGLTLMASETSSDIYDNLIDGLGNVVGKVHNDLQVAVIEDEELIAALAYKSNRNWTLPTIEGTPIPTTSANALVGNEEDVYITYMFTNTGSGFKESLPCMNYIKIGHANDGSDNVRLTFPKGKLPFMKTSLQGGFTANKMYVLINKTKTGERPLPNTWRILDVTTSFGGNGTALMNPNNIEVNTILLTKDLYDNAPVYDISNYMDGYTDNNSLNIGDENVLFGNVEVIPSAKVFKTSFVLPLMFNQFRTSINPTYDNDGGRPIYISEVGVYSENNELVLLGKLNKPLKKENSDVILLQIEVDF